MMKKICEEDVPKECLDENNKKARNEYSYRVLTEEKYKSCITEFPTIYNICGKYNDLEKLSRGIADKVDGTLEKRSVETIPNKNCRKLFYGFADYYNRINPENQSNVKLEYDDLSPFLLGGLSIEDNKDVYVSGVKVAKLSDLFKYIVELILYCSNVLDYINSGSFFKYLDSSIGYDKGQFLEDLGEYKNRILSDKCTDSSIKGYTQNICDKSLILLKKILILEQYENLKNGLNALASLLSDFIYKFDNNFYDAAHVFGKNFASFSFSSSLGKLAKEGFKFEHENYASDFSQKFINVIKNCCGFVCTDQNLGGTYRDMFVRMFELLLYGKKQNINGVDGEASIKDKMNLLRKFVNDVENKSEDLKDGDSKSFLVGFLIPCLKKMCEIQEGYTKNYEKQKDSKGGIGKSFYCLLDHLSNKVSDNVPNISMGVNIKDAKTGLESAKLKLVGEINKFINFASGSNESDEPKNVMGAFEDFITGITSLCSDLYETNKQRYLPGKFGYNMSNIRAISRYKYSNSSKLLSERDYEKLQIGDSAVKVNLNKAAFAKNLSTICSKSVEKLGFNTKLNAVLNYSGCDFEAFKKDLENLKEAAEGVYKEVVDSEIPLSVVNNFIANKKLSEEYGCSGEDKDKDKDKDYAKDLLFGIEDFYASTKYYKDLADILSHIIEQFNSEEGKEIGDVVKNAESHGIFDILLEDVKKYCKNYCKGSVLNCDDTIDSISFTNSV